MRKTELGIRVTLEVAGTLRKRYKIRCFFPKLIYGQVRERCIHAAEITGQIVEGCQEFKMAVMEGSWR